MIRDGDRGMSGSSIETTLELWASSLREVKRRMRPLFTQARAARSAENFLEDVLHRIDRGRQLFEVIERLVFGDVGVIQYKGDFVAKNFHACEQFTQIVLVKIVLEVVPPVPVRRHFLVKVVPELVLLHECFANVSRIAAVRDQQHDLDAVFADIL